MRERSKMGALNTEGVRLLVEQIQQLQRTIQQLKHKLNRCTSIHGAQSNGKLLSTRRWLSVTNTHVRKCAHAKRLQER